MVILGLGDELDDASFSARHPRRAQLVHRVQHALHAPPPNSGPSSAGLDIIRDKF